MANRPYDVAPEPLVTTPILSSDWTRWCEHRLYEALGHLPLGDYDRRTLTWLAGWEPPVVETIATWIERAREQGWQVGSGIK